MSSPFLHLKTDDRTDFKPKMKHHFKTHPITTIDKMAPIIFRAHKVAVQYGYNYAVMVTEHTYLSCCYCASVSQFHL